MINSNNAYSIISISSRSRLLSSLPCSSSTTNNVDTTPTPTTKVEIEYCTGCRWLLRSAWLAQG